MRRGATKTTVPDVDRRWLHVGWVAQQAVCERRVWRRLHTPAAAPTAQVAQADGEVSLAAKLRGVADLARGRLERPRGPRGQTLGDAARGRPATWVGVAASVEALGEAVFLRGMVQLVEPLEGAGEVVLCSYRASADRRTWLELKLCGLLVERAGVSVRQLAVIHRSQRTTLVYDAQARAAAVRAVERVVELERQDVEPWVPIGSWCRRCEHKPDCELIVKEARDVSLVSGLPAMTWRDMRAGRIHTVDDLADTDAALVAQLRYDDTKRVGPGRAATFIRRAQAHAAQAAGGRRDGVTLAQRLDGRTAVMFDVETDHYERVALWGLHVIGEERPRIVEAPRGRDGERDGWREFLATVNGVRSAHPDVCFVHWSHYDRGAVQRCAAQHGPGDMGQYVQGRLVDLYGHLLGAALPLKSYSQKSVELWLGFERRLAGREGLWAVNRLTEARSRSDDEGRQSIAEVVLYLSEDLAGLAHIAKWALREEL